MLTRNKPEIKLTFSFRIKKTVFSVLIKLRKDKLWTMKLIRMGLTIWSLLLLSMLNGWLLKIKDINSSKSNNQLRILSINKSKVIKKWKGIINKVGVLNNPRRPESSQLMNLNVTIRGLKRWNTDTVKVFLSLGWIPINQKNSKSLFHKT